MTAAASVAAMITAKNLLFMRPLLTTADYLASQVDVAAQTRFEHVDFVVDDFEITQGCGKFEHVFRVVPARTDAPGNLSHDVVERRGAEKIAVLRGRNVSHRGGACTVGKLELDRNPDIAAAFADVERFDDFRGVMIAGIEGQAMAFGVRIGNEGYHPTRILRGSAMIR